MQLRIFKYQSEEERMLNDITTLEIEGEIWFVAKDVCDALEIKNARDAISSLDEDEKQTSVIPTSGQNRTVNIINESGLYTLIFKSRKDSAKLFRKWVTKEVIPSIRKKGYYGRIDRTQVPNFYLRYKDNLQKIPRAYFSVISELFVTLNAEFEKVGYAIPDKGIDGKGMYPDISVGKLFSNYLEEIKHPLRNKFKTYEHSFPDDRKPCKARMYPLELLPVFRKFVFDRWVPGNAERYFTAKDPVALDYLPKLLGLDN
jgi:prophage antirepressor-like protein